MRVRISVWLLAVLFLQCLIGAGLEAQNAPASCFVAVECQGSNQWWAVCDPPLPPGVFNCSSNGWAWECQVETDKCPAICPTCASGTPPGTTPTAAQPINLATGDTFITQSDLSIPGLGGGLSLSRTWHSEFPFGESVPTPGMFGGNWRSTYEDLILVDPGGLVKYVRGTGDIWTLGLGGTSGTSTASEAGWFTWPYSMIAPANENLSLAYNVSLTNGATKWTLTFNTGEKRTFEITNPPLPMTWILTSITDRNGNTTQLTWNGSSLVTVTDPASRHLYFSYANNLVVGVSSDAGISLSYAYDAFGRLTTVTKPDLTTVSFQYDSNSMISAVVDTNGKVMEAHTYDGELRGVTSSRAGGVDAVTVTYPFFILGAQ